MASTLVRLVLLVAFGLLIAYAMKVQGTSPTFSFTLWCSSEHQNRLTERNDVAPRRLMNSQRCSKALPLYLNARNYLIRVLEFLRTFAKVQASKALSRPKASVDCPGGLIAFRHAVFFCSSLFAMLLIARSLNPPSGITTSTAQISRVLSERGCWRCSS